MSNKTYLNLLINEFNTRKNQNPSYSLRAFARDLDMSAPRLSQVLNKKQGLSVEAAKEVAQKLKCSELEKIWFCNSVGVLHSRSKSNKEKYKLKLKYCNDQLPENSL